MNRYKKVLFPIHLFQTNIRENGLILDDVLDKIEYLYKKKNLKVPDGWLTDSLFTTFDINEINSFIFHDDSIFFKYYHDYVKKFFDKPVEFEFDDIWLNVYSKGEFQEQHTHSSFDVFSRRSHFSCIHYLKFDSEVHEPVIFVDPIEEKRYNTIEMDSNYYGNGRWSPYVREGDLLMFPPYLSHYVSKSDPTPNNPRISISFNIWIKQYGDRKHGN